MSLAEIRGGSSTPSMVSSVLKWRGDRPEESSHLWNELNACNVRFEKHIRRLSELCALDSQEYDSSMSKCAKLPVKEVTSLSFFVEL